jgi:hypothetical protein
MLNSVCFFLIIGQDSSYTKDSSKLGAIVAMLNLNKGSEQYTASASKTNENGNEEIIWKVLIFDQFGQDIISSVMRVNDLRDNGVTVHM